MWDIPDQPFWQPGCNVYFNKLDVVKLFWFISVILDVTVKVAAGFAGTKTVVEAVLERWLQSQAVAVAVEFVITIIAAVLELLVTVRSSGSCSHELLHLQVVTPVVTVSTVSSHSRT